MRTIAWCALALFLLPVAGAAQRGVPHDVEFTLMRVERALQTGSPRFIEDLLRSGMIMRLGDSLYYGISDITALNELTAYFAGKDSIDFRLTPMGSGQMIYSSEGRRDTTRVDVWLTYERGGIMLYALNISNHPLATVFMNVPASRR